MDIEARAPSRWRSYWDSDIAYSFRRSPVIVVSAVITAVLVLSAFLAPLIAPHDPFDPATLDLLDAFTPPVWSDEGTIRFVFGTDDQGRDVLSAILYGMRTSLLVGFASMLLAAAIGVVLGLIAGYGGRTLDAIIMRIADVQLSFPAFLIAMLIDGLARSLFPRDLHTEIALPVVVVAIGLSYWVHYARSVRGSTLVERSKDYVQAAQVIGVHPVRIMARHILPNALGPLLVIGTVNLAQAIITEATLSFLGLGLPPTQPSLGTLIRIGNDFLFSGEWWIALFPSLALVLLVLSVNLLGDWLRDAINPKLR